MNDDVIRGFPWGDGTPSRSARILFAIAVGLVAASMHYFRPTGNGGPSDFTGFWYGSKLLLSGENPYPLIGPDRPIRLPSFLFYPAPALVAVAPFTLLPVEISGAAFVFSSAALLAYGLTNDGWYRVPILPSIAFFNAARQGQWSILLTASAFIPWIAFFAVAKPQASIPVLAGTSSRRPMLYAIAGVLVLSIASFILLPNWFSIWREQLASGDDFKPPILSAGGFLVTLVLVRWRRPEAWLVLSAACLPQTWYPYNTLILLTVAWTYREACVLSLVSSIAWLFAYYFVPGETRSLETQSLFRFVMITCCFLPSVIVVLRRPNRGPAPFWFSPFMRKTEISS